MSSKDVNLSEDVLAFSKKVKENKAIVLNAEGVFEVDGDFYQTELKGATGIEPDQLTAMQRFNSLFVAGVALAVGEEAQGYMATHKDTDRLTVDVPTAGRDFFSFDYKREAIGRNPKTKEEVVSYGVMSASHTMKAVENIGDYGRVREHLKACAKAAFGG